MILKRCSYRVRPQVGMVAVAMIVLSGCSDESKGTPLPATSNPPAGGITESGTPSGNMFGELQACDVLDKALEGHGFSAAVVDKAGSDNGCDADKYKFATVSLDLHPDLGIDDLNADPSKLHTGTVNGRRSLQIREGIGAEGDCDIAMEVTENSRAMTGVSLSTGTTDEACQFATEVAEKVEPQLPKGN
jgi:hypothetical protein